MVPVAFTAASEFQGRLRPINFPVWRAIWVHRAVLAVAIAVGLFVEFNLTQCLSAYARWPQTRIPDLSSRFSAWDGAHYLILSREGYTAGSSTGSNRRSVTAIRPARIPTSGLTPSTVFQARNVAADT